MTSKVTICSNALLMLGDKPINSFDEQSDRATLAANLYPSVRDFILRSHPWKCATTRVVLSPDATAPSFDYSYRFQLPGDCLRVLSVGTLKCPDDYEQEGQYLLMDVSACYLRYIYRNDVEETWDPMLVQAMTESMRRVFAYGVTASTSLEQLLLGVAADVLKQARAADGQVNPPEEFGSESLYEAGF
jgi:hypothetical protein